jgi:peptide-methionine (S)-S-oxide reductase
MVEKWRVEVDRQLANLLQDTPENVDAFLEGRREPRHLIRGSRDLQVDLDGCERLTDLVVELACDASALFFLCGLTSTIGRLPGEVACRAKGIMNKMRLVESLVVVALVAAGVLSWMQRTGLEPVPPDTGGLEKATLAGGCYWCMEPAFDGLEGVVHVRAGHAGEGTRRREAVEILFDPSTISYQQILDVFWRNIDPLDGEGQFCDRGSDYRSGIFVHGETQREVATASRAAHGKERAYETVTEILDADSFVPAAEHDQNYSRKHPVRYVFYSPTACVRPWSWCSRS